MRVKWRNLIFFGLTATLLHSCVPNVVENKASGARASSNVVNDANTVGFGQGRLLRANPIILSGNAGFPAGTNLNELLVEAPDNITTNQFLIGSCGGNGTTLTECFEVRDNENDSLLESVAGRWAFDANSKEFLQVNLYGHLDRIITQFHDNMEYSLGQANPGLFENYRTALPATLFNSASNNPFWFGATNKIKAYSNCGVDDNAFFSPSSLTLCFGNDSVENNVFFAQDASIIYHEMGHGLNQVLLNVRNRPTSSVFADTDLGNLFYDEAGSIGEGLADFWSFFRNQRTHFGEWALGRFLNASRPLSEDDPVHAPGISTSFDGRLSYPTFLTYDPNFTSEKIEDIHPAGQIISHFLVALVQDFTSTCSMSQTDAIQNVVYILMETMAELGDQTSFANDLTTTDFKNLNGNQFLTGVPNSFDWIRINNPINFRSFAQTFARYTLKIFSSISLARCNGGIYPQDKLEQLLDSYGLLLFETYNDNGNGETTGQTTAPIALTSVSAGNRVKTVLIPKDLLKIDPEETSSTAFVFDKPADMKAALSAMLESGQIGNISDQIPSDLKYNNGNARISPGEMIGISLNLFNDSNSDMAGVQLLANDWDHLKGTELCPNFEDAFPLSSEGAADISGESGGNPGECTYITRNNGLETAETLGPVCSVQINDSSATRWASQEDLITTTALDSSNCLGGSSSKKDCFVRVIRGADQAYFSVIEPQKTWAETFTKANGTAPTFNFSNVVFFEISPWIPPGTTFRCRMRARFSNCSDCFTDPDNANKDDFLDFEYSGGKPFKILHFEFTVID